MSIKIVDDDGEKGEEKSCFTVSLSLQPQTVSGISEAIGILAKTATELTLLGFTPTLNSSHFVLED